MQTHDESGHSEIINGNASRLIDSMTISGIIIRAAMTLLAVPAAFQVAAADTEAVRRLYAETCSVCHGDNGDGRTHARAGMNPPPRDFTTPGLKSLLTREGMIETVSNGKPGTAMTGFSTRLDQIQIGELVDYIRETYMINEIDKSVGSGDGAAGRRIYATTCAVCHGEDGSGAVWGRSSLNPPPANFTARDPVSDLTKSRMTQSVTHGRPGTAMTAFESQLSAADIEAVVDYIRSAFMHAHPAKLDANAGHTVSAVGMAVLHDRLKESDSMQAKTRSDQFDAPIRPGLVGDFETGRTCYLQNCTACHGENGTGDGPRAFFIYPRPRNFQHPASRSRFSRPLLFDAISRGVVGREMPAWSKVLSEQQIADVTEYVFRSFIRPDAQTP